MDSSSLLSFSKKRHPLLRQKTRCHSILRIIIKFHSPLCRNTEYQVSFPALSEHGISSVIPRLSDDEMSKVSSPVCLVQRCHQSKCLFLQTISLQIHFKFPNTTINTVMNNHYSPVKLQYPLVESGPLLQRIWVSLCSSAFKTNHLCHPTFIITSQAFIKF